MKKLLKILGIIVVVIIAIGVIGAFMSGDSDKTTLNDDNANVEQQNESEEEVAEVTKYEAGDYKVGSDIEPGEYKVFGEGFISYYAVSKDSTGAITSILTNENFSTFSYITVKKGQYLKLQSCYAIPVAEAPVYQVKDNKYIQGQYKVGVDIPAGEYKVIADADLSYVEVAKDSLGSMHSIVTNDIVSKNKYITVKDGQYLKMTQSHIDAK